MCQPKEFEYKRNPRMVYKLRKALYGQKRASRQWFCCFESYLSSFGFWSNIADPSLCTSENLTGNLSTGRYVDDMLILGENLDNVQIYVSNLKARYEIKKQDTLRKFHGISIHDTGNYLILERIYMIDSMLQLLNLKSCHLVACPIQPRSLLLFSKSDALLSDVTPYQPLIGSLL